MNGANGTNVFLHKKNFDLKIFFFKNRFLIPLHFRIDFYSRLLNNSDTNDNNNDNNNVFYNRKKFREFLSIDYYFFLLPDLNVSTNKEKN